MSKTTRFEAALLAIRTHARTSVSDAINSINAAFTTEANGFSREFNGTEQLTTARSHTMRASMKSRLSRLSARLLVITTDTMQAVTDDTSTEMIDAHDGAASDEGVEPDGLDSRFDAPLIDVQDRIEHAFGRSVALPVLIAAYIAEANDAANAFLDRAVVADVIENDVATAMASLLKGNDIQYSFFDLSKTSTTPFRSLQSSSDLIAMSESFNTMREATVEGLRAGGFVEAAPWRLSPRHTVVDVCDALASAKSVWGPGYYALTNWPDAPHPRCACSIGTPLIFFPVAQW